MNLKMDFKELKEEIIEELLDIYPTTGADEFFHHYLLSFAKVLKQEELDNFYKDLQSASKYPYISYNFEVFLKKMISLIEQYKKTS